MFSNLYIDDSLCTGCGICVKECGHNSPLNEVNRINPNNPDCIKCYHCYTACPNNAIKIKNETNIPEFNKELLMSINKKNLMYFLSYRRSIRNFSNKKVDDTVINKLIDCARYIPSGGNAHTYEFSVIRSDETKENIKQSLSDIYKMRSNVLNNVILRNIIKPFVNKQMRGFLKDKSYRIRIKKLIDRIYEGEDPFFHNAPIIVIIHSDTSIPTPKEDCILAGYNITLMAQAMGLGSCFVTLAQNAINASSKCKKILNLTANDNINAVIILGYPSVQHKRIAPKPKKVIRWL